METVDTTSDKRLYQEAKVKFNSTAPHELLCNGCGVVIKEGHEFEDRLHLCSLCMSGKCTTRFKRP